MDSNQPTGLDGVVSAVSSLVGSPHNYSASSPAPADSQPAEVSTPAAAADAADAPQSEERLTPEQVSLLR